MYQPNRESGSWLPQVETCPNRVMPCGNPYDADEAMRAGQIIRAGSGFINTLNSNQAMENANKIAKRCTVAKGECPLEKFYQVGRLIALEKIKDSV